MKQKIDYGNNILVRLGKLITKHEIIFDVLNKANIKDRNKASIIKMPNFKSKVIIKIWSKVDLEIFKLLNLLICANNYIKNFFFL